MKKFVGGFITALVVFIAIEGARFAGGFIDEYNEAKASGEVEEVVEDVPEPTVELEVVKEPVVIDTAATANINAARGKIEGDKHAAIYANAPAKVVPVETEVADNDVKVSEPKTTNKATSNKVTKAKEVVDTPVVTTPVPVDTTPVVATPAPTETAPAATTPAPADTVQVNPGSANQGATPPPTDWDAINRAMEADRNMSEAEHQAIRDQIARDNEERIAMFEGQ